MRRLAGYGLLFISLVGATARADADSAKDATSTSDIPAWAQTPGAMVIVTNPGTTAGSDSSSNTGIRSFIIGVDANKDIFICDSDLNMSQGSAQRVQCNNGPFLSSLSPKEFFSCKDSKLKTFLTALESVPLAAVSSLGMFAGAPGMGQNTVNSIDPNMPTVGQVYNAQRSHKTVVGAGDDLPSECGKYVYNNVKTNDFTSYYNSFVKEVSSCKAAADKKDPVLQARNVKIVANAAMVDCSGQNSSSPDCDTRAYAEAEYSKLQKLNARNFCAGESRVPIDAPGGKPLISDNVANPVQPPAPAGGNGSNGNSGTNGAGAADAPASAPPAPSN